MGRKRMGRVLPFSLGGEDSGVEFSLWWPSACVDRLRVGGLRGVILALGRGKEPLVQLSAGSGLPPMPLVQAVHLVL